MAEGQNLFTQLLLILLSFNESVQKSLSCSCRGQNKFGEKRFIGIHNKLAIDSEMYSQTLRMEKNGVMMSMYNEMERSVVKSDREGNTMKLTSFRN